MRPAVPLAFLLSLPSLPAQDVVGQPVRQWITGKAQRADGSPWSEARVVLLSNPWGLPSTGFEDEVRVRANDQGLFRALVQPGRTYTVFALSETEHRRYTASKVVENVVVGQPVRLVEDPRARVRVAVQIEGAEAWKDRAPLACTLMVMMGDRLERDLGPLTGEDILLPALPKSPLLRVVDRDGQPLARATVPLLEDRRRKALAADAAAGPQRILSLERSLLRVPPPVSFTLAIRGEGGAGPLRDAEVFWRDRSDMRLLARSDGEGIARLSIPRTWPEDAEPVAEYLDFWVWAPGHILGHYYDWNVRVGNRQGPDRELVLLRGHSIRGRLLWAPGQPAAKVAVLLHSGVPTAGQNGSQFHRSRAGYSGSPTVFWTDDEGRFEIPGRPGTLGFQLTTFLRGNEIARVPRSPGHPLNPSIVLAAGVDDPAGDRDLGDIVLAEFVPVDLEVVDRRGRPVPAAVVRYREDLEELPFLPEEKRVARARSDQLGRMRILGRPGRTLILQIGPEPEGGAPDEPVRVEVDLPERGGPPLPVRVELDG